MTIESARPHRIELRARSAAPGVVTVLLKLRPELWRAAVDGNPVALQCMDDLWTGVTVGSGESTIVLRARLPLWSWLVASLGLAALLALGVLGIRQ